MSRTLTEVGAAILGAAAQPAEDVGPQDGAALLDDVRRYIARFVAFPQEHALTATSLWAAHTHAARHFHTSPRLALLSPEPGSGKTRVLEVLHPLVPSAMFSFCASPAAIFRKLATGDHTLLFDEVDAIFAKRGKDDGNEDLRALLNVGYRRGATIPRCVGPRHEVQDFSVFAPCALAGLGDLPDTVMSRSIIIRMRRRAPGERVEQFRLRMHEAEGARLQARLRAWTVDVGADVGAAWPTLPHGVEDRNAEVWEPLLAVADAAGGHWPRTARAACVELLKVASEREVSLGVRLLSDLRDIFGTLDTMTTSDLLEKLNALEEAPWGDLYGKKTESRTLARMLNRYGIRSTKVKVHGKALQGYRREDLWDTWTRYLPPVTAGAEPTEPHDRTAQVRVQHSTSEVPDEVPDTRKVPDRPEPPQRTEPAARVPDAAPRSVPEVPHSRGGESPLAVRALDVVTDLRRVDLETLRHRYAQAAGTITPPAWWVDTAKAEPVQVTAALELIASDASAGRGTGRAHDYLAATRAAFEAVRVAP